MNQKVAVSIVFIAALFMNIMDITIVNVALPKIGTDLHVGLTAVSGVSIGYLVSLAVLTSVLAGIGVLHASNGLPAPNLSAYHVTFLVAAGIALLAAIAIQTIHDEDAASTRVARPPSASKRRRLAATTRCTPDELSPVGTDIHSLPARALKPIKADRAQLNATGRWRNLLRLERTRRRQES